MTGPAAPAPKKRYRAVILVMLACSILCALGVWQLKRLAWKQDLIATLEQRLAEPAVDIAFLPKPYPAQEWRKVRVRGEFILDRSFMVSPRTQDGKVGFHLFAPLKMADGTSIMVNRGFVAMRSPQYSEDFDLPPSGTVSIEGVVRVPVRTAFTPDNQPSRNEWYWPDLSVMDSGVALVRDVYIQQTGVSNAGYPRIIDVTPELPNNHAQYAVFWFGMAGLCLLVFVIARKKGYA